MPLSRSTLAYLLVCRTSRMATRSSMARYAKEVGQAAPLTGEVEKILGRRAHLRRAKWVADHADAFRN